MVFDSSSQTSRFVSPRTWDLLGVAVLALVLLVLSYRQTRFLVTPGDPARSAAEGRHGLADFQDVIYYPLHALRDGVNPYDAGLEPLSDGSPRYRQRYPVLNLFPLYSPLLFLLFWPWGYGDFLT